MARLRDAIEWVALNDSPGDPDAGDLHAVSRSLLVRMVADLWKKEPKQIARRVIALRSLEGYIDVPTWDHLWNDLERGKWIRKGEL